MSDSESPTNAIASEQADASRVGRIEFGGLGLVADIDLCARAAGEADCKEQEERGLHYSYP